MSQENKAPLTLEDVLRLAEDTFDWAEREGLTKGNLKQFAEVVYEEGRKAQCKAAVEVAEEIMKDREDRCCCWNTADDVRLYLRLQFEKLNISN